MGILLLQTRGKPALDLSFMGALPSSMTLTRASGGWFLNSSGLLTQVASDAPRFDYDPATLTPRGLLLEESRTNQALWSRDLTNAAWAKTTATTALTQTGIDGTANSATLLTSSAGNATALQTITQAATNSVFSVWLKRVTGSGTIQITQDNGSTWTGVTLTGSWQRISCPAQSTLNPAFGIRIVTNGDAVAVDGAQFEAGDFVTSNILTTSASVTRARDILASSSVPWASLNGGTLYFEGMKLADYAAANKTITLASLGDGTVANMFRLRQITPSTCGFRVIINSNSSLSSSVAAAINTGAVFKAALAVENGRQVGAVGGTLASSTATATPFSALTQLAVGSANADDVGYYFNGWVRRIKYWNFALNNSLLQQVTK